MAVDTTPFDPAEYIATPEDAAFFLEDAFGSGDARQVAQALGVIARSKGMTRLAEATGFSRQALYRALSEEGNPTLDTVLKVAQELGFRLTPVRIDSAA